MALSDATDTNGEARIEVSVDGLIATVVVSNPTRYNAITIQMWHELAAHFRQLSADKSVRVIVIRGAGRRAFVAGADLTEFEAERDTPDAVAAYDATVAATLAEIAACKKTVLAAISGFCIGAGVEIATRCDLRVADESASFAIPAVRLGVGFPANEVERIVQTVGQAAATEILITGRRLDAREALRIGLIHRLHDAETFDEQVATEVSRLAENAPLAITAMKVVLLELTKPESERDLAAVAKATAVCVASRDYAEARAAFAERRRPHFTGE